MEKKVPFLTGEGAHSHKQELPNNHFVNIVITVCSSTAWGSPWVEQAGLGGWGGGRRVGVTEDSDHANLQLERKDRTEQMSLDAFSSYMFVILAQLSSWPLQAPPLSTTEAH